MQNACNAGQEEERATNQYGLLMKKRIEGARGRIGGSVDNHCRPVGSLYSSQLRETIT
jgi:hypothetical protein